MSSDQRPSRLSSGGGQAANMLSVDVNLAPTFPQSLNVDRDGDAMPFAGCHVTEIKTGGANSVGRADVKFGVSRTSHPFGGDDVDQALFFPDDVAG